MVERPARTPGEGGLLDLRRSGQVTETLLLYEVTVHRHTRLRTIAKALGVSVQATSMIVRGLSKASLVSLIDGTYRPTVRGIDRLHASLTLLREDLDRRLGRLQVVRRTRALAARPLRSGQRVVLELRSGLLEARPGTRGSSVGTAVHDARAGALVEVEGLRGIVPLRPETVHCLVLPSRGTLSSASLRRVAQEIRRSPHGLVAAEGLEAHHLLRRVTQGPVARFGVAAAAREAVQMGVPALVLVSEELLPTFLQRLAEPAPVADVHVETLPTLRTKPGGEPEGPPPRSSES